MIKFIISCILMIFIYIIPIFAFTAPTKEIVDKERRRVASFPELPKKIRFRYVQDFLEGFGTFFVDRFPFRSILLDSYINTVSMIHLNPNNSPCYLGNSSWLFLGNQYNSCVDKLIGKKIMSRYQLEKEVKKYKSIQSKLAIRGAQFFILIGPNKSSIYPEYLPPVVFPAKERYIDPLVKALSQAHINMYDPTDDLKEMKSADTLYYRTDTHWNNRGATLAFQGFLKTFNFPMLPPFSFERAGLYRGDLIHIGGYTSFPLSFGDNFTTLWSNPQHIEVEGNVFKNLNATEDKRVWVFGDSFSGALREVIPVAFKEVVFFEHKDFKDVMNSQKSNPDIVIWVMVERGFGD